MTAADTAQRQRTPREGLLPRHPLAVFFLLAFAFSWTYWELAWALRLPGPLMALGALGPVGSAFLVLAITSGKPGVFRLLGSFVHWRVGVQWYLVTLLGVPVLMLLSYLVVPGALADFRAPDWSFLLFYLGDLAYTLFLAGGPLLEEGGWRGFSLPRLQRLHGPLAGTLILGALWGLWHLPFFFGPLSQTGPDATFVSAGIAFVEFTIGLIGLSVVMTWVLNNSGGSVLMAILLHAAFDVAPAFIKLFPSTTPYYVPVHFQTSGIAIVFSAAAFVIIIVTRAKLSYQRGVDLLAALLVAAVMALALATCGCGRHASSVPSQSSHAPVLPRAAILSLSTVKEVLPEMSRETATGQDETAVGNPSGTRSVTYAAADGSQRVVISVDQYPSPQDASHAYEQAFKMSQEVPSAKGESVSDLGQRAFIGVATQGNETHVGGGALYGDRIVTVTLQGYDATKENRAKVAALIRKQAAGS